ncbi:MAG TPA: hypothetical protein VOA64_03395 [Candidatus Dormibacteraeota bacterium]|nr:hypothetical protein [Candidatus Dormibacteraeota bacterium]
MKEFGLLILSAVVVWAGIRIFVEPEEYRKEIATFSHPIAGIPIWTIRALGVLLALGGV